MAIILYLSNKTVQAIDARNNGKKITVHNVWQGEAPEGSMINGIITDEEAFLAWIKDFFAKIKFPGKEIELVINSTQFNHKVLEFPKIKENEIKKMIPREFAENRTEDTLFTYYMMPEEADSGKQSVLATAVEREFLLSYITFFKQAGVEVVAVESGLSSFVKLFGSAAEIKGKTCLVQMIDDREVISMLFVKGMYYYSQKNRFFAQESAKERARELEAITDKLLQFATSQQIKEPVETLYLCGTNQEEMLDQLGNHCLFRGKSILTFENKECEKKGFLYPVGCQLFKQQRNSFYRHLKQEQKESKKKREVLELMAPSLIVIVLCLIVTVFMGNSYLKGMRQFHKLQATMQDSETVNASASYELSSANVEAMNGKITAIETIWAHLLSYPTLDASVDEVLMQCAGEKVTVSMKSFQRDSGVLALNATAKSVRDINGFVANLQQQEMFESVEYTGYSYVSGLDYYNIHVVLCMAEGAGR